MTAEGTEVDSSVTEGAGVEGADSAALIGIDWGSSRLRASVVSTAGCVIDRAESEAGVLLAGGRSELEASLRSVLGGWLDRWPNLPVIASGMVGSRNGLKEVAYVSTPAGVVDVGRGMESVRLGDRLTITIVPGLVHRGERGVDVMRGEETALLGWLLDAGSARDRTIVMPGTHSKWVRLVSGQVSEFCTFPTGEMFSTLLQSASLASLVPDSAASDDSGDFQDGVAVGLEAKGILNDYFAIRAQAVAGCGGDRNVRQYLSGLLLGYEIAEARGRSLADVDAPLVIIGQDQLARRYERALGIAGLPSVVADQDCLATGWLALARVGSDNARQKGEPA